jgi:carbamoyltransferase
MGLAPYGDARRFHAFFEEAVELRSEGRMHIPLLRMNRTREERENYSASRAYLTERLIPARCPDSELTDVHRDVAAALQARLDQTLLHLCTHFASVTGQRRVALAGGVALNCTANGGLLRSGAFDEIYVQPAAGDDGSALGAALQCAAEAGEVRNERMPVPFLGPAANKAAGAAAIAERNDRVYAVHFESLEEACAEAARLIAAGRVLGWHRGRMEFGPRALGARSILADPGHPEMRDRINAMVKMREAFRPFAPAVTVEQVHRWFDVREGTTLPYMIMTVGVRPEYRDQLPAITHVDGSARVQTVACSDNGAFHTLLRAVGRETGREMVLNTSFNVKGQPVVNTPAEAIDTFLRTGIDCLFIENTLVRRIT